MKRVFLWILSAIVGLGLLCFLSLMIQTSGVFMKNLSDGISDISYLAESQLTKDLPVGGRVYYVYSVLAEEYDNYDNISNYYYLIDLEYETETYMIVKAPAYTRLSEDLDHLYLADLDEGKQYEYLLTEGIAVDGILVSNESDVVDEYDNWKSSLTTNNFDMSDARLANYTLDCTQTVSDLCNQFIGSVVISIFLFIILVILIVLNVKHSKKAKIAQPQQAYGFPQNNGYIPNSNVYPPQNNGYVPNGNVYPPQNNGYVPNGNVYPPQNNAYIPQQNHQNADFVPAVGNGYAPKNAAYVPQENYAPRNNGYASQNGDYSPSSNYGANTSYNADNRYANAHDSNSVDKVSLKKDRYQ